MPKDEYRDHYDRLSWSELDKKKDKSKHITKEKREIRKNKQQVEKYKKDYLKEASKIFKGKKGTKDHDSLLKKINLYFRKPEFAEILKEYIDKFGFPDDIDTCIMLMDYKDIKIVEDAIKVMLASYENMSDLKKNIFNSKLRILKMTAQDKQFLTFLESI